MSRHRALITRPRAEAEALAAALERRGIAAVIAPMLEIVFRPAGPLELDGVQALLCTSANGVRALAQASAERGLPLFAVGDATAAAARLDPQAGRLLHVAGGAVAGDLAGALAARGFAVARAVLYDARPATALSEEARRALSGGEIDLALFFSPRSAATFVELASAAGLAHACAGITAIAISAAVDRALAALGWRARHIADKPDRRALLEAVDRALKGEDPDVATGR